MMEKRGVVTGLAAPVEKRACDGPAKCVERCRRATRGGLCDRGPGCGDRRREAPERETVGR